MPDWIFSSPRHEAIFTLFCSAWWACTTAFFWFRGTFYLGRSVRVRRSERPKLYWGMLAACLVITASVAFQGAAGLTR